MSYILISMFCTLLGFILGGFCLLPKRIEDDTIVRYANQRGDLVFARTIGHQYEGTDFVVVQRCDLMGVPVGITFVLDKNRCTWKDNEGKRWTNKVFNK